MYYCFCCPPPSFIVLEFYSLLLHESSCPIFSVCHFMRAKVTPVSPVRIRTANRFTMFANIIVSPWQCRPAGGGYSLLFKALICSDKRLISCCCLAIVSTYISRLAANSTSGPPFAAVCVDAAAMLSKYPSSKSSI